MKIHFSGAIEENRKEFTLAGRRAAMLFEFENMEKNDQLNWYPATSLGGSS